MSEIKMIAEDSRVQAVLAGLMDAPEEVAQLAVAIQQIPAPTFSEQQRAAYVRDQFESIGLSRISVDHLGNVYGCQPSEAGGDRDPVVVSAHTDTVFPADTDLAVRRVNGQIHGPGIGDNSMGVAGIIAAAQALVDSQLPLPADVWFAANVGEEGLGDLLGMRAVVDRFGDAAQYIVVEGGLYGRICHQAIGVRRYRVDVRADGGHSWGNFGRPSAIHELARLITEIDQIPVPSTPKTTYNVGIIEGGTSINTIAQSASFLLDLRSEDGGALTRLEQAVDQLLQRGREREGIAITQTLIGDRPAGQLPSSSPLIRWAKDALDYVGCQRIEFLAGSTDANIPLSRAIPAVCIGLAESGNSHRLDEFVDLARLPQGLVQLLLLVLAATGFQRV